MQWQSDATRLADDERPTGHAERTKMLGVVRLRHLETTISSDDRTVTIGRSSDCDVRIGPSDQSISRVAGSITRRDDVWWLTNRSASRPMYLVSPVGLRSVLPVKAEVALGPSTRLLLVGSMTYEIEVTVGTGATDPTVELPQSAGEAKTSMPPISPLELTTLVALAEGYFLPHPRYSPHPRTYAEAAERLGVPASTVRKRTENLRRRWTGAGVLGLENPDAREAVVEFAIAAGLMVPSDLAVLERPEND